jgi:ABC-type lipoprotein export system ATPase subunit
LVALRGLNLAVAAGDCVALIGANGSGKTTAVRAIAGLLEPTAGMVRVCGWDPHREPEAEHARAALALVLDSPLLYDDLTVRQHLELVTLSHGAAGEGVDRRITSLLMRLGLQGREGFLPRELSRGMRQKTQLACALIRPASVLVLDEPVVGLDPPSSVLIAAQDDIALARQWAAAWWRASRDAVRRSRAQHPRAPEPEVLWAPAWRDVAQHAQRPGGRRRRPRAVGHPRDSLHMIDLIYSQDAGQRPDVIITDTRSTATSSSP